MTVKVAVITDTHFDPLARDEEGLRRSDIGDHLMARAVAIINHQIKPDLVIHLGDVINDAAVPQSLENLKTMRRLWAKCLAPTFIIPGNHDPGEEVFYSIFDQPPDLYEIKGVGFCFFRDRWTREYNGRRDEEGMEQLERVGADCKGPLVSVQHIPLFPAGALDCPYYYENRAEIIERMEGKGFVLSISGHFHAGAGPQRVNGVTWMIAPSMFKTPHRFMVLEIDGARIAYEHCILTTAAP